MSNIGVIGDIHCENAKLEMIIRYLKEQCEHILAVGDIVDGKGNCNHCIELLSNEKIKCVKGNHDKWLLEGIMRDLKNATKISDLSIKEIAYLRNLNEEYEIQINGNSIILCHGIGKNNMACIKPYDYGYGLENNQDLWRLIGQKKYNIMIGGHTHQEMIRKIENLTIINPGSLNSIEKSNFAIIDINSKGIEFYNVSENEDIRSMGRKEFPES